MSTSLPVYDSAEPRTPLLTEIRNVWGYRRLIRLLVVRELTVRYKRSVLGVWWTLLNPLLTTGIFWLVFGVIIGSRFGATDEPYVVYLLSGVILISFFSQGFLSTGAAIRSQSGILSKVYVPPEVFAVATSVATAVNFLISFGALLVVQLWAGVGIPWTIVLSPIPILSMLALVAGLGMLLAAVAVYFFDVLDLTRVLVQLLYYMTPVFWTISFIPEQFHPLMRLNPLFAYLEMFRDVTYRGVMPELWIWLVVILVPLAAVLAGVYTFGKSWKTLVSEI